MRPYHAAQSDYTFFLSRLIDFLRVQCVGFRGFCLQILNQILKMMFSLVYNHLKLRQTLARERAFCIFRLPHGHNRFSCTLGRGELGNGYSVDWNLQQQQ